MRTPDIRPYKGKFPQIAASAYIDPAAVVIGDVVIGEESSVWPMTVVRGDVHHIRIGKRTNIQDGCVLHVMKDQYPLVLGDEVTVGHSVTLHGCNIHSHVLIGMGCIILNGAVIGENSIIAAGTLITERTVIPAGSLVMGSPGKVKRELTEEDCESIGKYAERYAGYSVKFTARKRRSAGNKLIGASWKTEQADAAFQGLMAEKKKFQAIKGTRDLLPPETELWNRVEQTAREVFGTFGFGEIRPPIFEPTELFARAIGGDTDIVVEGNVLV